MRTLILALLALLVVSCYQDDFVEYVDESIYAIVPLPDGGAICAGVRDWHGSQRNVIQLSSPVPNADLLLLRTDAQGNVLWERTFEDNYCSGRMALRADADGGFSVAGFGFGSGDAPSGGYVIKTDSVGYPIWNTMVGDSLGWGSVVVATADGGFAFLGIHLGQNALRLMRVNAQGAVSLRRDVDVSVISGYGMGGLVETDDGNFIMTANDRLIGLSAQGDSLWARRVVDQQFLQLAAIPGGFAACGLTNFYSFEVRSIVLEIYEANGEVLWTQRWHAVESWWPIALLHTTHGGYLIAGNASDANRSIFTITTDAGGAPSRVYSFSYTDRDHIQTAAQLSDGGFLLGGSARVPHIDEGYGSDALLVRLNSSGSPLWHRTHGM